METARQAQLVLCCDEEQLTLAKRLFSLECRYLNGEGFDSVTGRRVVCLDPALAPLAYGYASETKTVPEPLPTGLDDAALKQWIKENAKAYNQDSAPAEASAAPIPSPPAEPTPQQGAEPVRIAQDAPSYDDAPPPFAEDEDAPQGRSRTFTVVSEDMGAPADLWGQDSHLAPIPIEAYPASFVQCTVEQAEIMGCDPGMLLMWRLGVAAGCVTDEIALQVKANDTHWLARPRCWLMVVGDSGTTMKSPSLDAAMAHAWKIERELRLAGAQALKDYEIEQQIYEAKKAEYVKARAKGNPAEMPAEPMLPIAERLIVGNATLEAVSDVLLQQGERGILVRADELLGIISGMNQYKSGKGSDRTEWLEAWNGGPHPIDRKGRAVLVKNWGISLIGGTQPEAIARVGGSLETDGLLQRFTVYLPRMAERGADRQADKDGINRYRECLDRLVKLTALPMGQAVRFSPDAQHIANTAFDWIFETLRASWMPSSLRSHLAKWRDIYARFCITYACIEAADEHQASVQPIISAEIAEQVWKLMLALWPHAKQFYLTTLSGAGDRAALRQIAGLILAEGMGEITTRTMTQRSSTYRAAREPERRAIVSALCELGWLHPVGGKSSITGLPTRYRVNEIAHSRYAEIARQEKKERADATARWDANRRQPGAD